MPMPRRKRRESPTETAQEARLAEAEKLLGHLRHRAHVALVYLDERQGRNHWRESVSGMIQGGADV